ISIWKNKLLFNEISKIMKCKKSTISNACYRTLKRKSSKRQKGSSRKRSTTKFEDNQIILKVKRNDKINSTTNKKELQLKLHTTNIRKRLNENEDYSFQIKIEKKRIIFAKFHQNWTINDWKKV